jgi:hypothetical protein
MPDPFAATAMNALADVPVERETALGTGAGVGTGTFGMLAAVVGGSALVVAACDGRVLAVPKSFSQRVGEVWDAVYE